MPTRACLTIAVALLSILAAACGRAGEDPPTATRAYDDFVNEITDTTCERVYQCPEKAPSLVFYLGRFENEGECKIVLQESSKAAESTEQIKLAVDEGRIAYDAEQAEVCLAALDTELAGARCAANFDADVPACDKVFVGKVAALPVKAVCEVLATALYSWIRSDLVHKKLSWYPNADANGLSSDGVDCERHSSSLMLQIVKGTN